MHMARELSEQGIEARGCCPAISSPSGCARAARKNGRRLWSGLGWESRQPVHRWISTLSPTWRS